MADNLPAVWAVQRNVSGLWENDGIFHQSLENTMHCYLSTIQCNCSQPNLYFWQTHHIAAELTDLPLDEVAAISQKIFSDAFLAATKQLNDWFSPSVRLSVCLSVCDTFLTMFPSSYHHEIFRSCYLWQMWRPCKRSRSEVKGQGHRGHDPT